MFLFGGSGESRTLMALLKPTRIRSGADTNFG